MVAKLAGKLPARAWLTTMLDTCSVYFTLTDVRPNKSTRRDAFCNLKKKEGINYHRCVTLSITWWFHWLCFVSLVGRFDFLCMPLFHPRFRREFESEPAKSRPGAQTRSDLLLCGRGSWFYSDMSPPSIEC